MAIYTYPSIITLNINELSAPIKRHRVTDWIYKKKKKKGAKETINKTKKQPMDWEKIFASEV